MTFRSRLSSRCSRTANSLTLSRESSIGRSSITIDENRAGKLVVAVEEQDSGHNVMTVADVAAFLQTDRASVRRMTGDRAQHRSHHPIPFVKIGAKMLRFSRPAIEAWWDELCASKNGKSNTSALALPKGKVKKNGRD